MRRFCLLMSLALPALASVGNDDIPAKEALVWGAYNNGEPLSITNGPARNPGFRSQILALFQDELSAYEHVVVTAPLPRILTQIKNGSHWCFIGATKTPEREAFAYFSLPSAIELPSRIYVSSSQRARFTAMGVLSLETLLQDRSLRTSLRLGRVFNPEIDALFKRFPPSQTHADQTEGFQMLLANRLDFLLDSANFLAKQSVREEKLTALPFKEMGSPGVTRIMCPKNAWGKQVINKINTVLRAARPTERYRQMLEMRENDSDARVIRALYDSMLLRTE